jgi:hypothetical protein
MHVMPVLYVLRGTLVLGRYGVIMHETIAGIDTFASIRAGHTRAVAGRGAGALTDDSSTPRVLKQINKQGLGGTKVYRGRRRRCIVTCDRVVAVRLLYFKLRFSAVQGAPLIFQLNNNQIARLHWFMLLLTRSGTKHRNIKHACVHP